MKGTNQLSKARLSRSLKRKIANSASRGEISAKRMTKQPMQASYRLVRRLFKSAAALVTERQEVGAKVGGDEKETR